MPKRTEGPNPPARASPPRGVLWEITQRRKLRDKARLKIEGGFENGASASRHPFEGWGI